MEEDNFTPKALGSKRTEYSFDHPNPALLEAIPWKMAAEVDKMEARLRVEANAFEFTSLCPVTGQPDWATIIIEYEPDEHLVESKSLKLYLMGFRNHGEFHESCTWRIAKDIYDCIKPLSIKVIGKFNGRGGISINPAAEICKPIYDRKTHRDIV